LITPKINNENRPPALNYLGRLSIEARKKKIGTHVPTFLNGWILPYKFRKYTVGVASVVHGPFRVTYLAYQQDKRYSPDFSKKIAIVTPLEQGTFP